VRDHSVSKSGRVIVASIDDPRAQSLIDGRTVHDGFAVTDDRWQTTGLVCAGRVADVETHAAAIDVALRGADVVADVAADRVDAFVEDVDRAQLAWWTGADELDESAVMLLDELSRGASVAAAAHRTNLSPRSAHRRLADARARLGVATNAEAIAAWRSLASALRAS